MRRSSSPDPNQEALIIANNQSGLIHEVSFDEPTPPGAVDVVERKLHLMNTLGQLAGASMRQGLENAGESVLRGRYGERSAQVIEGASRERVSLINGAKESFARATGHYALIDVGVQPQHVRKLTRGMFSDFLKKYYRKPKESHDYLDQLADEVVDLQTAVSSYNRDHQIRRHQPEPTPKGLKTEEKRELDELNARERSSAIRFDPRAQFIPIHNRMRNFVMPVLDYLDNPDYPLGINNQMYEILVHQQKQFSAADGIRGVESIAWEVGDYLADAAKGHRLLTELKDSLSGIFHRVTLAEELGTDAPAIPYLLRFAAAKRFVETGDKAGLTDPLRTKEDRWVAKGAGPASGKHKTVHSVFTAPKREKKIETYIEDTAESMTVGQAMRVIDEAISNEYYTTAFMVTRLQEMSQLGQYRSMEPVMAAIIESFKAVQDEPAVQALLKQQKPNEV